MNIGDVRREIPWNKDSHEERVPRDVSKIDGAIFISKVQKQKWGKISLEKSLVYSNTIEKFAKIVLSLNYRAGFKIFWILTCRTDSLSHTNGCLCLSVCQLRVQSGIHNKVWVKS